MVLYRGFSFQSLFMNSLHSFISFMYSFYSSMYCYCYMVAVIVDMIGMFHIILLWIYPYVIPMIPLCGNP